MIKITFIVPSVFNNNNGEKKLSISSTKTTLLDVFKKISENIGIEFKNKVINSDGTLKPIINVYINGKNSKFYKGMETTLKDGDEIYILPAVAGGSQELSDMELNRYSRQIMLENIGYMGQLKLRKSSVCVVGVGGLGNPITTRLTAMGIGKIRIVDRDIVELSNLPRQTIFDDSDIGKIKVEIAKKKLQKINPSTKIEALPVSINDHNSVDIIDRCDVVIDALDSVNARYSINKACIDNNIPLVTGAAVGTSGQSFTIIPKKSACYYCMFPDLDDDYMPTCSIEGVHPSILSIISGIETSEAINILLGKKPNLIDKILHVDLDTLNFVYTKTLKILECPICGNGNNKIIKTEKLIVEELCSRKGKRTFSVTPTNEFEFNTKKFMNISNMYGFNIENKSELGISINTNNISIDLMKKGSAIITGAKNKEDAISFYNTFVK